MKKYFFLLLVLPLMSNTCLSPDENHHSTINFVNNSKDAVYITSAFNYPDTIKGWIDPISIYDKVLPHESNSYALGLMDYYENVFPSRIPSGVLMIYVADAHLVETIPWDTIKAKRMFLKRFDLTQDDLGKMNWTVNYPYNSKY